MSLRIVYCGTPDFAATSLRYLLEKDCNVIAVVTMPDKKQGRGRQMRFSPVKELALEYELPLFQPDKATDPAFLSQMETLNPDLILVCAYGKILRQKFIDIPQFGCVNLHASLLPQYRGPSPIQYAILNGDTETGMTTFLIDEGMDSGDIILEQRVSIDPEDTTGTLHDKLADVGAQLLYDTVKLFEDPPVTMTPQADNGVFYTQKITPEMSCIDWNASARTVHNLVRAMNPAPGARTKINGKMLKIFVTQVVDQPHTLQPGQIVSVDGGQLCVACGEGQLCVSEVQLEGKSKISADAFLRGYQLQAGQQLG